MTQDPLFRLGAHIAERQAAELERRTAADDDVREALARRVTQRPRGAPRTRGVSPAPLRELRAAILEAAGFRPAVLRAAVLRAAVLRPALFRPAGFWPALFRPAVLLAMVPLAVLLLVGSFIAPGWLRSGPRAAVPLTFTVGGQGGVVRAWESAPKDRGLTLEFSDGSRVDLKPKARARVVAVDSAGAEIVIESGQVAVHVVPHAPAGADYRLVMGPFGVEVKGTRFDVGWNPDAEAFSLELYDGRVRVTGCGFGAGREVPAGFRVEASCQRPGFSIDALDSDASREGVPRDGGRGDGPRGDGSGGDGSREALPDAPAKPPLSSDEAASASVPAAGPQPTPPVAGAGTPSSAPSVSSAPVLPEAAQPLRAHRSSSRAASATSWQTLAHAGRFVQAYELAARAGFERECLRASVEDVVLLGDAARHAGQPMLARRAYTTVRRRAPESHAAAEAAFALGRLSLDEADPREARRWFSASLDEHPHGPLAPAARDRLFELAVRAGDADELRKAAALYLRQAPDGAHAEQARAVLAKPESRR